MRRYYIYVLCDPRDSTVRYVGCSVDPKRRLTSEMNYAKASTLRPPHGGLRGWIFDINAAELAPIQHIIDVLDDPFDASDVEQEWVTRLRSLGAKLENHPGKHVYGARRRARNTHEARKAAAVSAMRSVARAFAT